MVLPAEASLLRPAGNPDFEFPRQTLAQFRLESPLVAWIEGSWWHLPGDPRRIREGSRPVAHHATRPIRAPERSGLPAHCLRGPGWR